MCEVVNVKSSELFSIIKEIFDHKGTAKIRVTGSSMLPFLRHGRDSVELAAASSGDLRKGDIALIVRDDGQYVLHRVIIKKSNGSIYINGDSHCWAEGPIKPEQLVAKVKGVWREDRHIPCSNIFWRLLSGLWIVLLPFRSILLRFYFRISPLRENNSNGDNRIEKNI